MTGLWTNNRDTLADGLIKELDWVHAPDLKWAAGRLIATGVVQVLDPDDTELVERGALPLARWRYSHPNASIEQAKEDAIPWRVACAESRAVIEALRQP
jgi:hypothetical protein